MSQRWKAGGQIHVLDFKLLFLNSQTFAVSSKFRTGVGVVILVLQKRDKRVTFR